MKLLLFIPALNAGGAERVMVTIANYMANKGDKVKILTLNAEESFYSVHPNVVVEGMNLVISGEGFHRKRKILSIEKARRKRFIEELNVFQPDLVLSFLFTTNIIAISSKKHIKCPLIVSERNDPLHYSRIVRFMCCRLYPRADRIVCQGQKVAEFYARCGGQCTVIGNPLNPSAIGNYSKNKVSKIVNVGRLTEAKNQSMLIDAFSEIKNDFPNVQLEIYGEGELRKCLDNQIKQAGLSDRVSLCGNKRNVMTMVSDYSCFILTSNYEGFPNVLIEAMASGMPVISTDFSTGIASQLISDNINGFVIPVGDKISLISSLRKILTSGELREKMGTNNLYIRKMYSENSICNLWDELFHREILCQNDKL